MNAVQWYSEIEQQFNYRHDFIGGQHSAEQEKLVTGTCKAYDRDMQSRTRKDTLGMYLPCYFVISFSGLGYDRYIFF